VEVPGLIVAGVRSGAGKTTITLGLLRALARRGLRVAGAKVGPDYIDPAFHAVAAGRPAISLDPWAMRATTLTAQVATAGGEAALVICEGVMGLFDGIGVAGDGSTADLSRTTGWPVVLVLDAQGTARSVAATLLGFTRFRPGFTVAGAIVNRVGGIGHADTVTEACRLACPGVAMIGCLPREAALELPSRHLGLVQAAEHADLDGFVERVADLVDRNLDLGAFTALARPARFDPPPPEAPPVPPLGQRIAVARDAAFGFAYRHVLDGWAAAGAEVAPFSPLADEAPDPWADGLFLPGGYPELHAGRLAANRRFLDGVRSAADRGVAIYGECGGYMALGQVLIDADGEGHAMAGLLPVVTSIAEPRLSLGYRALRTIAPGVVGPRGASFRGHEFHYATTVEEEGDQPLFQATDATGRRSFAAGKVKGRVAGSFLHLVDRWEA
jgi:cobyrinic acid a,c-diamide synthase